MGAYFELEDDLWFEGRWYLAGLCDRAGTELDSREFQCGRLADLGPPIKTTTWKEGLPVEALLPLTVILDQARRGVPLDFTLTNEDMPVVTSRVGDLLASIAGDDIQRIPVAVESRKEQYEILNIVRVVDCIDTARSEIQWFEPGNTVRPDLAGQPEMVTRLMIDRQRAGGHHIFRVKGWELAIIVSDTVRNAMRKAHVTGVRFLPASA